MRYENGSYVCSLCGTQVELRAEDEEHTQIRHSSDHEAMRVVIVRGQEVHRCPLRVQ